MIPTLIKNYNAGATVNPLRIVKFDSSENIVQASAASDRMMGISTGLITSAAGQSCDVVHGGIGRCIAGGTIEAGQYVTSDADGKAVVATSSRAIGVALNDAEEDDEFNVLIAPVEVGGAIGTEITVTGTFVFNDALGNPMLTIDGVNNTITVHDPNTFGPEEES